MFSPFDDPEHWFSQEREARAAAQAASHAKAREFLLRLAGDYRKRAVKSEERQKRAKLDRLPATA
jgi:hypothetical protein